MLALLIKPAVLQSRKGLNTITQLEAMGGVRITGHTPDEIRTQLINLADTEKTDELTLIACGGDGTVHLALNALVGTEFDLAVVPLGTGNDFARYLGIASPKQGINALTNGTAQNLDVGRIQLDNGAVRHYAGIASCGFDAQVNERANGYNGPSGAAKYLAAVVAEIRSLKARNLNVVTDEDVKLGDFTLVAIGNTNSYGGGMKMCPTANATDGQFEVTFVDKVSRRLLIRVLPTVFWGGHVRHPKVSQCVASSVKIHGEEFLIYADGERVGPGPANFTVLPNFVRVWRE